MATVSTGSKVSTKPSPTISQIMHKAIAECIFPGGTVAFGLCTMPCYYQAYGTYTYESTVKVTPDSIWDMASLTKIMVTTPCIMILFDRQKIALDDAACKFLPKFGTNGKQTITVRHLLTHTAGLREFYPFLDMGLTKREEVLDYIMKDRVWYGVGTITRYSDLSMIVLGLIVEQISCLPLEDFARQEIFEPLSMRHTSFRPIETARFDPIVVPTEIDRKHRNRMLWGEVHDPTAFVMGGVAGHAGLFSTINDVCRFAQVIMAGGLDRTTNCRIFEESTVQLFTTQTPKNPCTFGLGWDMAVRRAKDGKSSAGKYFGPRTFGHTGFSGTSLWIDPDRNMFVTLLTNAIHPTAVGGRVSKVGEIRPKIADAAVQTMGQHVLQRDTLTWHLGSISDKEKQFLALRLLQQLENLSEFLTGPNPVEKLEDCLIGDVRVHDWPSGNVKIVKEGRASHEKTKRRISFENPPEDESKPNGKKPTVEASSPPKIEQKRKIHVVIEPPYERPLVDPLPPAAAAKPEHFRRTPSILDPQASERPHDSAPVSRSLEGKPQHEDGASTVLMERVAKVYTRMRELKHHVARFSKHMGAFNKQMDKFKSNMEACKSKWYNERTQQWEFLNNDVSDFNREWKDLNNDVRERLRYLEKDIKKTRWRPHREDRLRDDGRRRTSSTGFEEDDYEIRGRDPHRRGRSMYDYELESLDATRGISRSPSPEFMASEQHTTTKLRGASRDITPRAFEISDYDEDLGSTSMRDSPMSEGFDVQKFERNRAFLRSPPKRGIPTGGLSKASARGHDFPIVSDSSSRDDYVIAYKDLHDF